MYLADWAMIGGEKKVWTNPYVTDGLIAMWDGIENAGWGVHDPNATVCVDLSGNGYDLTLANCTIEDDAWFINTLRGAYVQGKSFSSRPVCFELCASRIGGNDFFYTSVGVCFVNAGGYWQMVNKNTANNAVSAPDQWTQNSKIQFSAEYSSTGLARFSLGGVGNLTIKSYSNSWPEHGHDIEFGSNTSYFGKMRSHNIRFYSRALTAEEISANYAVDKMRFNLPDA